MVDCISHRCRSTKYPLFTNANLCDLLVRPSGERSRAGVSYRILIARKNEFGVPESQFGRCSPNAQAFMCTCQLWVYVFQG